MTSKYTHVDCLVVENTVIISEQENSIVTDLQVLYFFGHNQVPFKRFQNIPLDLTPTPFQNKN
jgi:hypothetical protein